MIAAPVEAFQNPWELGLLVNFVDRLRRKRKILEVGTMHGGTLYHWLRMAGHVVAVDDEMRSADEWEEWAAGWDADLDLLQGSSHDPALVATARRLGPYDFAFIDADHTYESVRADWENYGPMASIVAFHDILPRPGYGVSDVWAEIKAAPGARYMEICQNETLPGFEGPCGIGVVWLD